MLDEKIVDNLREISIRGRLAYGASCLENAIRYFDVKDDLLEKEVLSRIWAFTSSSDLSEWDKSVTEIDPVYVLHENRPSGPLKILYKTLPSDIPDLISDVIEIGAGNLYGGTGDYSPFSLNPLERVIIKCISLQIELPQLEPFKKSRFTEEHGWGIERDKSFFIG